MNRLRDAQVIAGRFYAIQIVRKIDSAMRNEQNEIDFRAAAESIFQTGKNTDETNVSIRVCRIWESLRFFLPDFGGEGTN